MDTFEDIQLEKFDGIRKILNDEKKYCIVKYTSPNAESFLNYNATFSFY